MDLRQVRGLGRSFDLVTANLFTSLLLEIRSLVFSAVRPGGTLLLSGIFLENLAEFRRGFRHPDFKCLRVMRRSGWAGLVFRRTKR
jgi:ribosomal protein L11 methylase PrmA